MRAHRQLLHADEDLGELVLIEGLLLEQRQCQFVEDVAIVVQHAPGLVVGVLHQLPHLGIHLLGNLLGIVASTAHLAPKHLVVIGTEFDRADIRTHSEFGHHLACCGSGLLDVIRRAGGGIVKDDLFGDTAAHRVGELVEQFVAADRVPVFDGHDHRVSESTAAREDRDLGDRVGVVHRRRDESVAPLVVGGDQLLLIAHHPGATLRAGHHAIDSLIERAIVDELSVRPRSEKRGLVEHVGEIGAGKPWGLPRKNLQVDAGRKRFAFSVNFENLLPTQHVGGVDADLTVEPAGAQEGRVEDVGAVRRGDEDDVGLDVESVHLDQ